MTNKIIKGLKNPVDALHYIYSKIIKKNYTTISYLRSFSDNGIYPSIVSAAVYSESKFKVFRRNPHYRRIVSVSKSIGEKTLDAIDRRGLDNKKILIELKKFDEIGSPIKYDFNAIGSIDPNLIRYLNIGLEIKDFFGDLRNFNIVEVGCGFGGQFLVLDHLSSFKSYTLIDIPVVLKLISKFIESFLVNNSYRLLTINQFDIVGNYDLFISNYAYSELPKNLREIYLKRYISKIKRGYIIVNSGDHIFDELHSYVPTARRIEEKPISHPGNYVIIWGGYC